MNVLIVEDELHTASLLKEIIEESPDFMVVEIAETIVEAVQYLSKYQPKLDLLFFDIHLADGYSFEIFKHIDIVTPIIFCTAYDEYVLKAIKNNGIDYILKPFKNEEIYQALDKYRKLLENLTQKQPKALQAPVANEKSYQTRFITQQREKSIIINAEEIALFYIESEVVYLCTFKGEKLPFFKKLDYIESVSNPHDFFRINRQMLVNRKAIASFEAYFNRKLILSLHFKTGQKLIVSRLKVSAFKKWLQD